MCSIKSILFAAQELSLHSTVSCKARQDLTVAEEAFSQDRHQRLPLKALMGSPYIMLKASSS